MRILSDISYSWRTLGASKSRTFLTMLGVIIGVMSLLLTLFASAVAARKASSLEPVDCLNYE